MTIEPTGIAAPYRVLVVDDVAEARAWMARIVRTALDATHGGGAGSSIAIVEAGTMRQGVEACERAGAAPFHLALIDLGLPDGDGFRIVQRLTDIAPETVSVVTTVMASDAAIVRALSAGARGYLLKDEADAVTVRQLAQIDAGIPAISPAIARRVLRHFQETGQAGEPGETGSGAVFEPGLTPRERDVLARIAKGLRVLDVARELGVAETTVASHVKAIYQKLGISNRAEATLHAARMGLVQ